MKTYQDLDTGELWRFDDDIDVMSISSSIPINLTPQVIRRPSSSHKWLNGVWVLDTFAAEVAFGVRQSAALGMIESRYSTFLAVKTGYPSEKEVATWDFKVELADAIIHNELLPEADKVPYSARAQAFMASANIVDWVAWAKKVLANSVNYSSVLGAAEDARKAAKVPVRAAKIDSELDLAISDVTKIFDDLDSQP